MITTPYQDFERACLEGISRSRKTSQPILISQVQPIDGIQPLSFFQAAEPKFSGTRSFWSSPNRSFTLVALGSAWKLERTAGTPFLEMEAEWQEILHNSIVISNPMNEATGPLLLGGFTFDPQQKKTGLWRRFSDTQLTVPQFVLTLKGGQAWLTTNCKVDASRLESQRIDELMRLREQLLAEAKNFVSLTAGSVPHSIGQNLLLEELHAEEWKASVECLAREIREGKFDKVVLARELRVHAANRFRSEQVLDRLLQEQPGSYVFAIESDEDCFVGATPERLVRREGDTLLSTCLAGTIRRGETAEEDELLGNELLEDPKNRVEHAVVVRTIKQAMMKVCHEVVTPEQPELLKTRYLQHLFTPVTGTAREGTTLLSAVGELHPTPALGGEPKQLAMAKIRQHEQFNRGFYGAPIGWIDAMGNGEFVVAIRSALLQGAEASLFAGCGIVGNSEPESEYRETRLKFRPMLSALGGVGFEHH